MMGLSLFFNKKKDIIALFFLLVLLVIFFWKAATLQGVFVTGDIAASDISELNYPIRVFAAESFKFGTLPLWNPYNYCGFPICAEGQAGVFYPLNLLLYRFLPAYAAFNYTTILNYFLAGFFTYLFCRSIFLRCFSSFISAVVFMFCGFLIAHLKHSNMIAVAVWLPMQFLSVEMFFQKKKVVYLFLISVILAIQVFAGHPQMTLYSLLGVFLYFLFRLLTIPQRTKKERTFFVVVFIFALVVGLGLAAIQLLPTYEVTQFSDRAGGMSSEAAMQDSFRAKDFIRFIFPYFFGDPANATYNLWRDGIFWEKCFYVGLLPLLLVFISINKLKQRKYFIFFGILAIISLILIMGKNTPIFPLLLKIPGISYFRFPGRFIILFEFAMAVLTGISLDYWFYDFKNKFRISPLILKILFAAIIIFDLFNFGIKHNPVVSAKQWFSKPETVRFLEKDKSLFRIHSYKSFQSWPVVYFNLAGGWSGDLTPYVQYREVLQQNTNMLYHLSDSSGYFALNIVRLQDLFWNIYNNAYFPPQKYSLFHTNRLKILGLLNVKYIITLFNLPPEGLEQKMLTNLNWGLPQVKIYRNKFFMPRAFVVPQAKIIKSEQKILRELFAGNFNPKKTVLLEEDIDWGSKSFYNSWANIIKYSPQEVGIIVNLSNKGFLVVSDTYYPGWKVFVDGEEKRILRANYVMRAVALDKGNHRVKFVYDPLSFKMGMYISLFFFLVVCSSLVWILFSSKEPCLRCFCVAKYLFFGYRQ